MSTLRLCRGAAGRCQAPCSLMHARPNRTGRPFRLRSAVPATRTTTRSTSVRGSSVAVVCWTVVSVRWEATPADACLVDEHSRRPFADCGGCTRRRVHGAGLAVVTDGSSVVPACRVCVGLSAAVHRPRTSPGSPATDVFVAGCSAEASCSARWTRPHSRLLRCFVSSDASLSSPLRNARSSFHCPVADRRPLSDPVSVLAASRRECSRHLRLCVSVAPLVPLPRVACLFIVAALPTAVCRSVQSTHPSITARFRRQRVSAALRPSCPCRPLPSHLDAWRLPRLGGMLSDGSQAWRLRRHPRFATAPHAVRRNGCIPRGSGRFRWRVAQHPTLFCLPATAV